MNIYKVPEDRRYWVVRADSGQYYSHFLSYGLIALGHLNFLELEDFPEGTYSLDWETLQGNFHRHEEALDSSKRRNSSHLTQVKTFIYDMKVGDWVITVGHGAVRFGRIVGPAYIEKSPLIIENDRQVGRRFEMNMHLRRSVVWGPGIARANLPYGLTISLKANQTLFCLDTKWEAVYHSLYPAFIRQETLYLSAKITTTERIRNHSISSLFKLLDEIEVIGKEFSAGNEIIDFEETFSEYVEEDELTITTKAEFHSPGEIWNAITSLAGHISVDNWATYTVAAYGMIFGNQKLGFDGIIDLDTRKKMWDLVIDRIRKNRAEKVVDTLKLELPTIDTSKLEDSSNDKKDTKISSNHK